MIIWEKAGLKAKRQNDVVWALPKDVFRSGDPESWNGIQPVKGKLMESYYHHPNTGGPQPVEYFLPDQLPEKDNYAGVKYLVTQWYFADSEEEAVMLLRITAERAIGYYQSAVEALDGIINSLAGR